MLLKCNVIYGGASVWSGAPELRLVDRAFIVPEGMGYGDGGVFNVAGKRLQESCLFRGVPERHNIYKIETTPVNSDLVQKKADGKFLYLGPIHNHYGHFIVSTLSRLWSPHVRDTKTKIIYSGNDEIEDLFKIDYMRQIFRALSLPEDRFIKFREPTVVTNMLMPAPSFNENIGAYTVFKDLCAEVGRSILKEHGHGDRSDRPVYLTKENLRRGVAKVINEAALSQVLQSRGYEIIAPETLSFIAQVQLFNSGRAIVGGIGSGFHTSAFTVPEQPNPILVALNTTDTLWSNHPIIDRLSTYKSIYLYDTQGQVARGATKDFTATFEIVEPENVAVQLAECVEAAKQVKPQPSKSGTREQSRHVVEPVRRPMGLNLTLDRQWSRSQNSHGEVWRIDLGEIYRISGLKFLGTSEEKVTIQFSRDGEKFHPTPPTNKPYADALPGVFIWTSWGHDYGSHVRIATRLGSSKFTDIEVFGEPVDELDAALSPQLDPPLRLAGNPPKSTRAPVLAALRDLKILPASFRKK